MTIPVIETDRLRLRGWEERDFPAYLAFAADPDHQAFFGGAMTKLEAWDHFCAYLGVWALRGYGYFAVADRASDEAIGLTGLWFPPVIDEPELSWSLFPGRTGNGYATEAAIAARAWAYGAFDLPPLTSIIHPENAASKAVAARVGAVYEKEMMLEGEPRHLYRHPK